MPRIRSTHRGRCQACDSLQKLPGGRLAAHGYTTRWGFFEGTCNGAGQLPFEQSKSYIDSCIEHARVCASGLRGKAAAVMANISPAAVRLRVYLARYKAGGVSGYQWIETRLGFDAAGRVAYWHPGDCSRQEGWHPVTAGSGRTLAEAAAIAARRYADHLDTEAANFDRYIAWQLGRVAGWKPAELTPIDPPTSRP